MKKICLILSIIFIISCSGTNTANNNTNVLDSKTDKKIVWEMGGHLPSQTGMDKNIGTAGVLYGSLGGKYIVVGGGANFPEESVLNGGAKKTYSDIYMLEDKNGVLEVVEHINLENEIGYGASVTTDDGIYYIGGSSNPEADDDILFITLKDNKLNVEKIGDLPFTLQNGVAVYRDNKLYIITGKQAGKGSNKLYEYDLAAKETKELAPVPGEESRTQAVAQLLNGNIYVFSGGDLTAYTDGYKYDFDNNTWTPAADVALDGEGISLLGAASVKLNESEMLVIGGFNKAVYDDAVYNLGNLQGTELANFRAGYFGADPYEFNWNSNILIYNCDSNTWRTIGEIPFDAPCGEGLILIGNKIYSINGEIKPGVRTDKMYVGTIIAK
ncbi:cyclically-permuted mutarotase family protein [Brachyspira sp. G79]|uniref:cyclically-permuted mutarotase family protein n=1 Tax=Brachyspira sp. G79 TaxID=1358104 RepID=UPI000BBC9316|nr:cyclically-permuted mutarotase family protein [Brachyspira sp. G79]PCG19663.1 3',5'-cyclic-nucleotide phosphodiesterase [Brachyspira sp. G79]